MAERSSLSCRGVGQPEDTDTYTRPHRAVFLRRTQPIDASKGTDAGMPFEHRRYIALDPLSNQPTWVIDQSETSTTASSSAPVTSAISLPGLWIDVLSTSPETLTVPLEVG